jgi:hypothetical protein
MTDDDTAAQESTRQDEGSARERAISAYEDARESVADSFTEAPLIALAGGIAAGALIAALLPRTQSETRFARPYAKRAKESARAAFTAAKDTGSGRLQELGLTRSKGEETVRSLFQGLGDAAKASAEAALQAARDKA